MEAVAVLKTLNDKGQWHFVWVTRNTANIQERHDLLLHPRTESGDAELYNSLWQIYSATIMWTNTLELNRERAVVAGSEQALCDAIRRGADLRVGTGFLHNEHIDPASDSRELVEEIAEFGITYLIEDRWVAGIMNLRQPVSLMPGFGPGSSMSFFMYNQNGEQALARAVFEASQAACERDAKLAGPPLLIPKYQLIESHDEGSNRPSVNYIYQFECYRYWVRDDWTELFSHGSDGETAGSIDELERAVIDGCEVKVGIRGLCTDLASDGEPVPDCETFVRIGACYYYTGIKRLTASTHPLVRVRPAIPMRYASRNWDFGWLVCRTDGFVERRLYIPGTLTCADNQVNCAMRWFVR